MLMVGNITFRDGSFILRTILMMTGAVRFSNT